MNRVFLPMVAGSNGAPTALALRTMARTSSSIDLMAGGLSAVRLVRHPLHGISAVYAPSAPL